MSSENRELLDAIRSIVGEALAPLAERIDGLTERVDGLTERMDRMETEQHEQRVAIQGINDRLGGVELRLISVEAHTIRLEGSLELLDGRTGQIARDVFELQQQIDRSFRSLKQETMLALGDVSRVQSVQRGDQDKIKDLEDQIITLRQRVDRIEERYGGE